MILLVGYGNPMRSDDGVGIYAVNRIAEENMPGVMAMTMQQLHVELLEEAVRYEKIILADATTKNEDAVIRKVETDPSRMISSHHLGPELFLELARTVYGKGLNLYLCSIQGENFDIGNALSEKTRLRAEKAVDLMRSFIAKDLTYA